MNVKDLESRIKTRPDGYGHYTISIRYCNKWYHGVTDNMRAIDRIQCEDEQKNRALIGNYTYKSALEALYNQCKLQNALR